MPAHPKPAASPTSKPVVYIDGEAGTTGLEIRRRLDRLTDIEVRSIDAGSRKDDNSRLAMMRQANLIVLCLPDPAALQVAGWLAEMGETAPKVVDASTAHRVAEGWVYGFPEMEAR